MTGNEDITGIEQGTLEKGSGTAIVMLHGIGGCAEVWQPQVEAFSATHRAVAWDLPGYGATPSLQETTFAAVADALDALLDRMNITSCHLIGHSLGGMVAQEMAVKHPGRLLSLTLSATSPAFGNPDGDFQREFVAARLKPLESGQDMAAVARDVIPTLVGPGADPNGTDLAAACMARVPESTYRSMIAALVTFDRRAALETIAVPTLVLAGSLDRQASAKMMERMAAKIPTARFVCLDHVGHLANLEAPETFNHIITDFLTSVEAA